MITYTVPTKRIGATHWTSLKTPYNVSDYSSITAVVRSKTGDRQELVKFAKVAAEGIKAIRVDELEPNKFYCDIDSADTAKGYDATYEIEFVLMRPNANYSSGFETKIIVKDVVKLVL